MNTLVRVNLLPREVEERQRGRQVTTLTVGLVVLLIGLLGILYVLKLSELSAAEEDRAAAQGEVVRLQARVAELQEYRQLDERRVARRQLLMTAMSTEISWSKTLNDISLAFPASASLRNLNAAKLDAEEPTPGEVTFGPAVARISFDGYSVERVAPGVEAVLIQFEKVPSFFNVHLSMAAKEEIGQTPVTGFTGAVELDEQAYTDRYADGIPPEVAQ